MMVACSNYGVQRDCTRAMLYLASRDFLPGTGRAPPFLDDMEETIREGRK
ncbi:hypothetical protein ANME2D_00576 [Candidatus Methanoperedens nitroreducens]|uniref:Uncharacterized protein n=1 Tax=Candidatus Methanoperedens nitratireducens TaxID=1392998 RepID=A0A062VAJ2_9EURY|nr:hypothetical protein [Candidatus Methanoperedens nitroreducens]KCZ73508.1 hypothetical protein ANME2D_00576 [Candidatus Methanoperedens nitroreducens]MDJ1422536.1 hypothetical protein [Candidatus Methanoperedens sp.]